MYILGYPTGYSQPNFPIKWSQKVAMVWCGDHHGENLPETRTDISGSSCQRPSNRRRHAAVADDWCWGAEAEGEAIAGDGRCSTQGAAEY